jgi:polysaccharide export outer membrane protein
MIDVDGTRGCLRPLTGALRWFAAAGLALGLAACSDGFVNFPLSPEGQATLPDNIEVIVLEPENISNFTRPARGHQASQLPAGRDWTYTVGPGDILSVIVFNHPELTLPAGAERTAEESGFMVNPDGTFSYPYIGSVVARGRTQEDLRQELTQRLSFYIPEPQVQVRIAAYNSQAVVVSGEVRSPNRQALTPVPLSLIEAINAAGGFTDRADPRAVRVLRGGQLYTVDLAGFMQGGLTQNNPILRNGDVVNVPRRRAEEAYLLGEIGRTTTIDLSIEPVTLTQAITRAGGPVLPRADARGILVFRNHGDNVRVFQLDVSNPTGLLLGTLFVLEPGDVVYVLRSALQRWNDTIARIIPTVNAIRAAQVLADNL